MKFNIAHLDKVLLLQTLYLHAKPVGYGEHEYAKLLEAGEPVEGLSTAFCKDLLRRSARVKYEYLVDYHNGKPLKIEWNKISRHQSIMDSTVYDKIHGRFRFLEALLNVFNQDEILVTDRFYSSVHDKDFIQHERRMIEFEIERMLHHMILVQHEKRGAYWQFDADKVSYKSALLQGLSI